jgi:hypothetical protein
MAFAEAALSVMHVACVMATLTRVMAVRTSLLATTMKQLFLMMVPVLIKNLLLLIASETV